MCAAQDRVRALADTCLVVVRSLQGDQPRQLALLVLLLSVIVAVPANPVDVPDRVVHLPGVGWVDAERVAGLSAAAPDGAVLRLDWQGSGPAILATPGAKLDDTASGQVALGGKISLNHASVATLEGLPGVGPALAARIVAGRPYATIDDLERVKGFGAKTLAKLTPLVQP